MILKSTVTFNAFLAAYIQPIDCNGKYYLVACRACKDMKDLIYSSFIYVYALATQCNTIPLSPLSLISTFLLNATKQYSHIFVVTFTDIFIPSIAAAK